MDTLGNKTLSDSPCIGICSTTYGDNICCGCNRHYLEVINWNTYSDEVKLAINLRLYFKRLKKP